MAVLRLAITIALLLTLAAVQPRGGLIQHAAATDEITVRIEDVDDSAFPVVRAVVRADRDGKPLDAVLASQVRVLESGALARIDAVERAVDARVPLGLVLVMDVSGSMAGAPLANAKASAASLVRSLAPGDGAALVTFASTVTVAQPMTTDHAALLATIDRLAVAGNTALYDAVGTAAQIAAASTYQRRAVVLISDGRDAGDQSARSRDASIAAVAGGGVLFYAVGFGDDIDRPYLDEVALRSGGTVFVAPTVNKMAEVFAGIESLLRSQFVITFTSAASAGAPAAGAQHTVAVTVETNAGTGGAERAYVSRRPVIATTPVPPRVEAAAPESEARGSAGLPLWSWVAALALGAGAGVVLVVNRARRRARAELFAVLSSPDTRPLPQQESRQLAEMPGRLVVVAGPHCGQVLELGDHPVTIGSATTCGLRLPEAVGVARQHARLWRRDGRPMLHHLDAHAVTEVNGREVDWTSIGDADEIRIGPYLMRYEVGSVADTRAQTTGGVV